MMHSLTTRNCLRAKPLMIAALCTTLACLVLFVSLLAPFWIKVSTRVTYPVAVKSTGDDLYTVDRVEFMGITGYVDYDGRWHNLNMIVKSTSNRDVIPVVFKMVQFFYITGFMVAMVATVAVVMLALKPYRHFVAEVATTAALFYSAIAASLSIILAFSSVVNNNTRYFIWPERRYLPVDNFLDCWAMFIAIIGAFLLIVAAIVMLMESLSSCRKVEHIRSKPKKHLEDEPRYYKFNYSKIPKVNVEPHAILVHAYTNPTLSASTPPAYHAPSAYSHFSYSTQPTMYSQPGYTGSSQSGYMGAPQAGYMGAPQSGYMGAPQSGYTGAPQSGYTGAPQSGYPGGPYGDSDRYSYGVSVDEHGRRMVSM